MRGSGSRREGKPVTSDAFVESEPIAAPYGKFLIYTSDRTGGQHLFRMDADGANVKQLTFDSGIDTAPDVSRDGKWIVYSSNANNQNRIWKLPIGGGSPIQLTYHGSVAPSFSPDGTQVACNYPGDSPTNPSRLDVVSFETGTIIKSFEVLTIAFNYRAVRWTPAGDALIFAKNDKPASNLWKQDLAGGEPKQFTDFSSQRIYYHAFSRDGKRLLISRGEVKVNVVMLRNFSESAGQ